MRTRAERRYSRYVKKMRRLKEDWNQHSADRYSPASHFADSYLARGVPVNTHLHCPCFWDAKAQAMFADTPKRCGGLCCANPRHHPMISGDDRLTIQERRAPVIDE